MASIILRRTNFYASRLFLTAAAALSVAPKILTAEFCSTGKCNDEVEKAKLASVAAEKYQPQDTIFGKILRKEIPADIIYEDDKVSMIQWLFLKKPTSTNSNYPLLPKLVSPLLSFG